MICYNRLFNLMKKKGISTYRIRKDKILSVVTLLALQNNEYVSTKTINTLCAYLECQPEDIMEYIPDP